MISKLLPAIINLTNSVIGVSLMTIPFTFAECGLILSIVVVVLIALITITAAEFLLKLATYHNKLSYEELCQHIFGKIGKSILELNMIGMMYGSLIAYVIIIGDLCIEIVTELFNINTHPILRFIVLLFSMIPIFILCMKKNVEKLANASAMSLMFYSILSVHLIFITFDKSSLQTPIAELKLWNIPGLLAIIPIISLGMTIQTQVFTVFNSMKEPNKKEMQYIIRISTSLVAVCYSVIGTFGYMKFANYSTKISADLLSMYPSSFTTTIIRMGFLISVGISYPLTTFPIRSSLYSLLFVKKNQPTDLTYESSTIPDDQFKQLTIGIVASSFIIGSIMSNVEVILSLTGSFCGSIVLFILPSLVALRGNMRDKSKFIKFVANAILFFGICILSLSFYNSIYMQELIQSKKTDIVFLLRPNKTTFHNSNLK